MNKNFIPFTKNEEKIIEKIADQRIKARKKFPFVEASIAVLGLQATFYGFQKMMDQVPLFAQHPWIIFAGGIIFLIVSGTVYKVTSL